MTRRKNPQRPTHTQEKRSDRIPTLVQTVGLSLAVVLTAGALGAAQAPRGRARVAGLAIVDSPLTVTPAHVEVTTPQRVASVTWEVTNVGTRPVTGYSVRVYIYRDDKPVGFKSTHQPIAVRPGRSQSAATKLDGGDLEIRAGDVVVIRSRLSQCQA
jgi:hypothetical protein